MTRIVLQGSKLCIVESVKQKENRTPYPKIYQVLPEIGFCPSKARLNHRQESRTDIEDRASTDLENYHFARDLGSLRLAWVFFNSSQESRDMTGYMKSAYLVNALLGSIGSPARLGLSPT